MGETLLRIYSRRSLHVDDVTIESADNADGWASYYCALLVLSAVVGYVRCLKNDRYILD